MNHYVIQVPSRSEDRFLRLARRRIPDHQFICPKRELKIRRGGRTILELPPLFPGYLFLDAPEIDRELFMEVRRLPGFIRFLENNDRIVPLGGDDLALVRHFLSFGEVVRQSQVRFDRDQRIVVVSGPMQGMEGRIIKVDKRKGRAKVRLDLYSDSFPVDLGFEIIEDAAGKPIL